MQRVNIHRKVELVTDNLLVFASELVGAVYALCVPVCPVEAVLKHRDSKGMWEACSKKYSTDRY